MLFLFLFLLLRLDKSCVQFGPLPQCAIVAHSDLHCHRISVRCVSYLVRYLGKSCVQFELVPELEGLAVRHVSAGYAHSAVITGEGKGVNTAKLYRDFMK